MNILIVEDNIPYAKLLEFTLQRGGYNTHHANTIESAKEAIDFFHPDVAIVDLILARERGTEFIAWAKSIPKLTPLRFIAMTGSRTVDDIADLQAVGIATYFSKMSPPSEIFDRLKLIEVDRLL